MVALGDGFRAHRTLYTILASIGGLLLLWAVALVLSPKARRCLGSIRGSLKGWYGGQKAWWQLQCRIYGSSFVLFQVLVNLVWGIATAWWFYFNPYYQRDELNLEPVDAAFQQTLLQFAPALKPLMGVITDNVPICGSTRGKYFILTASVASACYFGVFLFDTEGSRAFALSTLLLFSINTFGYAWCGIVLYSMTAEKAKLDRKNGAENLNTIQWGMYSLGSLIGDIIAPHLLRALGGEGRPQPDEDGNVGNSGARNCTAVCGVMFAILASLGFLYEDKRQVVAKVGALGLNPAEQAGGCANFKEQMRKLWGALNPRGPSQGVIFYSVLFIFLTWAVIPDVSYSVTFYFYTGDVEDGGLGFDSNFWSVIQILGDVALLAASYAYGACLTNVGLRKLFIGLQVLNVLASIPDVALARGWHEDMGISPKVFAPVCIFFYWFVWQLKLVPVYTLSAKICPAGIEGTMSSFISCMNDLGGTVALAIGTWLTAQLGITFSNAAGYGYGGAVPDAPDDSESGSFDSELSNLWLLYTWRTIMNILPIFFVVLVPSDEAIQQVMESMDTEEQVVTSDSLSQSVEARATHTPGKMPADATSSPGAPLLSDDV